MVCVLKDESENKMAEMKGITAFLPALSHRGVVNLMSFLSRHTTTPLNNLVTLVSGFVCVCMFVSAFDTKCVEEDVKL